MKSTKVVPLRIPKNLDALAALSAQAQYTDKATALRQWLHQGAAHYVVGLVSEGRVSMGRAAELLDLTVFDLYRFAEAHGIELGASDEQRQQSRALARKLAEDGSLGLRSTGSVEARQ
jgi:hypothetical protein